MSQENVLCFKKSNLKEFSDLIEKDSKDSLEFVYVNHAEANRVENNFVQLVTYVAISTYDLAKGKYTFLQYTRPSKNSESRLSSKRSVGFGGHINTDDWGLSFDDRIIDETVNITKEDLLKLVKTCATRELKEELGLDVTVDHLSVTPFQADQTVDVNKVHMAMFMNLVVDTETFNKIANHCKDSLNVREIEQLASLTFNIDTVVENFNFSKTVEEISKSDSYTKQNLEPWSHIAIFLTLENLYNTFLSNFKYADLVNLYAEKVKKLKSVKPKVSRVSKKAKPKTTVTSTSKSSKKV